MKKTIQMITFSILLLLTISFMIFGQIKANEAYKASEVARNAQEEAIQIANMAQQQALDAAAQARIAEAHALSLAEQLKQCQSN